MNCNIREQLKYVPTCVFRVIYMVADAWQRLDFPDCELRIEHYESSPAENVVIED